LEFQFIEIPRRLIFTKQNLGGDCDRLEIRDDPARPNFTKFTKGVYYKM